MSEGLIHALRRNLRRALLEHRLDEAEAILARLEREDPLSVQTRGSVLELLLRRGRLDEAERLAEALVDQCPESARVFYLAGRVHYRRRRYPRAVELLRESVRIADVWRSRHWLGKALTQAGELDEAEAILVGLIEEHPLVSSDLGWVHERRGDLDLALEAYERSLTLRPEDGFIRQAVARVRAGMLGAEALSGEIESLVELGEEVPEELLPEYVESLLTTGRAEEARALIAELRPGLEHRTACRLGWICHRLRIADLAFDLLLHSLSANLTSVKHLTALEADAARAGEVDELCARYAQFAPAHPRLWGRLRRLQRRRQS